MGWLQSTRGLPVLGTPMLWLSWKSKGLACPQAQGGQQMWREEALTPQEVLGVCVETVRPSLVYSMDCH